MAKPAGERGLFTFVGRRIHDLEYRFGTFAIHAQDERVSKFWHLIERCLARINERDPWCQHLVIDDVCEKPEHRYCMYCHKAMPNARVERVL